MIAARALLVAAVALAPATAFAQQVFLGDPVDPGTGQAWPVLPGLPLVLPGPDEDFGTGDDVLNTGITGDVDLVVRSGSIVSSSIPAPSLAPGGPAIATSVAGGGSTGVGAEAAFTVMVSDGTGSPPYGNVITNSDMDLRPVTVYAFADLDGDGILGPTDSDGSGDNSLELQEVTAYAGRQMGALESGRFSHGLGLEIAAPSSLGGLTVGLVAGAYTGSDPEVIFTDGPLVLTHWPVFPPLDPKDILGGGDAPAPDPTLSNELEWDIETNYRPSPSHPTLGSAFEVPVDGSEATTDQILVESAGAASARVFAEPVAAAFLARARPRLRVAPEAGGPGRALVLPVDRVALAADGAATQLALRVLAVDLFSNVADPGAPMEVALTVSGPASIVSPDADGNPKTETLVLENAEGATIVLDDDAAGQGRLQVSAEGAPVQVVAFSVGAAPDHDGDGVSDDGNDSGLAGDWPCDLAAASCDDNCPLVINPSQVDDNHDGLGDCCDGTCLVDPQGDACDECALPASPTYGTFTTAKLSARLAGAGSEDKLTVKLSFPLPPESTVAADVETVSLVALQAGSGGYAATLASLFTDLAKALPAFRYLERDGLVDGVVKAQVRMASNGSWKMVLKAKGVDIADLAPGSIDLTLALGDDIVSGALDCSGTSSRLRCQPLP